MAIFVAGIRYQVSGFENVLLAPHQVQILFPEFRTHKEADDASKGHEESERQGAAPLDLPHGHEQSARDGPEHGAKEHSQGDVGTKESPEHTAHLDVSHAHPGG